jgi:uncharacterized protein YoxC
LKKLQVTLRNVNHTLTTLTPRVDVLLDQTKVLTKSATEKLDALNPVANVISTFSAKYLHSISESKYAFRAEPLKDANLQEKDKITNLIDLAVQALILFHHFQKGR